MTTLLIAEDDANIRTGLIDLFDSEGYRVLAAAHGREALALFATEKFDLLLLDIMMPEKSGYEVCREIRKTDPLVPIIMLTAKSEEIDKVVGLKLGADDYITKPFGVHELLARVESVLRRASRSAPTPPDQPRTFSFGTSEINMNEYRAKTNGHAYALSAREMELLRYFRTHPNDVLSRNQLLDQVWGVEYMGTTRTLDQHISQLRKKVELDPAKPTVIQTVHGIGYKYTP